MTFTGRVVTFHESVEQARLPGLLTALTDGATVLLLTDAGMPSVSDPGYTLVRAAIDAGVHGHLGARAVRGDDGAGGVGPAGRPVLLRGVPAAQGRGAPARLAALADERRTMVFFESPHRLADALADAAAAFGDEREAAVCRELTKTYEEVRRGGLAALAAWAADGVKGEITLVVGGAPDVAVDLSDAELAAAVAEEEAAGATRKDAIRAVVTRTGLPRRTVYDAVLAAKRP